MVHYMMVLFPSSVHRNILYSGRTQALQEFQTELLRMAVPSPGLFPPLNKL